VNVYARRADDGGRRLDGGHGVARGAARDRHRAAGFEFGGGAPLGAGAAQIDNSEEADFLVGNGFRQARAHAKTQRVLSPAARGGARAERSGAPASVTASTADFRYYARSGSLSPLRRRAQAARAAHTATAPLGRADRPRRDPTNRALMYRVA